MNTNNNSVSDINNIHDNSAFVKDTNDSIIKVIGVGGGGGNAVNYMFKQNIPHVNFVVCNTDNQALKMSPVPTKLLLGPDVTHGLGAGNVPEVGKKCAEASTEDIKALFQDKTEMVFITAGMGGGTGTGAAPVVAKIAKECGMLTIGIVTVPFLFEGDKKIVKAIEGAKEMKKHVDALLVINNENLISLYPDWNFFNAFGKADDTLANAAQSISDIISEPCYINVDFQDVKTILKDSGTAIISTAVGEGEHRITDAIHNALHSPLLNKHDINTSQRLLFKFICWKDSPNPLRAEEIREITKFTSELPKQIDVKWGIGDNPEMGDKVKITVLASGFDVTLGGDKKDEKKIIINQPEVDEEAEKTDKEIQDTKKDIYGTETIMRQQRDTDKLRYAVLTPDQLDDREIIMLLEQTPALNRDSRFNDNLKKISEEKNNRPANQRPRPAAPSTETISFGDFE